MRRRLRPLLLVAGLLLGCGPRSSATAPASTPPTAAAPAQPQPAAPQLEPEPAPKPVDDPFSVAISPHGLVEPIHVGLLPKPGAAPLLRLDDPGAEPRTVLRYGYRKGDRGALEMTMDMTLALQIGGRDTPTTALPRTIMVLDVGVDEIRAERAFVSGTISATRVEALTPDERPLAESLAPKMAKLVGMKTTYWIDARGFITDPTLVLPPDVPAEMQATAEQMRESLTSFAAPLPEEPVGVGARWRTLKRLVAGGVDTLQVASYTVTAASDKDVAFTVEVAQYAATGVAKVNGVDARLLSYRAGGGGTSQARLDAITKVGSAMEMASEVQMQLVAAGKPMDMGARATMKLALAEAPAKAKKRKAKGAKAK